MESIQYQWLPTLNHQDGSGVIGLYNAVIETETVIGYQQAIAEAEAEQILTQLNADLEVGRIELMLIKQQGIAAGMVILKRNHQPNCAHIADLSKGIIHPKFRRTGLLKSSFLQIAHKCKQDGIDLITLDVRKNSRSHQLWVGLGFNQYGELNDYARVGDEVFSGVYLYQSVDSLIVNLT